MHMVSIVIMAHGQLSEALGTAAAQIVGGIDGLTYYSIDPQVSLETIENELRTLITSSMEGCIILVDLLGGSPFMLAGEYLQQEKVRLITGMNLPMLIALQTNRNQDLKGLFDILLVAGRAGIKGLQKSNEPGGPLCLS